MADGLQTGTNKRYSILRVHDGVTADVVSPTASTDGVAMPTNVQQMALEKAVVLIYDRSGTGVLAIGYAKVWGYVEAIDRWFPVGTGADADRGKLNDAIALGEVQADNLRLAQQVELPCVFDRIEVELNGVAGTNPVIDVDILLPRRTARQVA